MSPRNFYNSRDIRTKVMFLAMNLESDSNLEASKYECEINALIGGRV